MQQLAGVIDTQSLEPCIVDVDQAAVEVEDLQAVATAHDVALSHLAQRFGGKAAQASVRVDFTGNLPFPCSDGGDRLESWRRIAPASDPLRPPTLHGERHRAG